MDALVSFAKENFQFICLIVGLVGVVVAVISLLHEIKAKNHRKNDHDK